MLSCGADTTMTLVPDPHHHHHEPRLRSATSPSSNGSCCNGHDGSHGLHRTHTIGTSKPKSPLPPPPPQDPNSCTFVTRLELDSASPPTSPGPNGAVANGTHHNLAMPISVQIPKDIVANVVADLVRYQREHQEGAKSPVEASVETSSTIPEPSAPVELDSSN